MPLATKLSSTSCGGLAALAQFVTSVCTGALLLGAAGLLRGKRAATHWAWRELLVPFGAIPDAARGRTRRQWKHHRRRKSPPRIDFALSVVAELSGPEIAQAIQLQIEYAPEPPFDAGVPETAPPASRFHVYASGWRRWRRSDAEPSKPQLARLAAG